MTNNKANHRASKKVDTQKNRITELKKLLVYYKEITETIRGPFIILDNELVVVTANQAFYRMFKVRKKDTEGRRIYELGDNQWDIPELRKLLEHILPKKKVMKNYEVNLDFPALGHKSMVLNARQVDSKQLILLSIDDMTAQKTLQLGLGEMTANLVEQRDQLQKLNLAKDEFIKLASHQLRTPVTTVKQYVGMLLEGYAGVLTQEQVRMLTVAYENNQRQLEIIEDLLRIAKVDDGKVYLEKSSSDVVRQIEQVIREQSMLFKSRGQQVVFHKPKAKMTAYMDQRLILMVLENILDNAGKYSEAGAQITIDLEQGDTYTTISIKDNGVGIRQGDRKRLFQKFSRIENPLSPAVFGTGLGLYWVKKIIDLHKGSIEVKSRINQGSTFTVKLPNSSGKTKVELPSSGL